MSNRNSFRNWMTKTVATAACLVTPLFVYGQHTEQPAKDTPPSTKATTATSSPVSMTANDDDRYRIGPGDVLDIRILNRPNLSREAVRVEGSGMIRMPLIDTEIQAACKT